MSYVRFNEDGSDVYVYEHYLGFLDCCGCKLSTPRSYETKSRREMIGHLRAHQAMGHTVPEFVFKVLEGESEQEGDEIPEPTDQEMTDE